ncbi:MAG: cell envelope integrity EipB family protein [Beijerinckiaceae bacterium]
MPSFRILALAFAACGFAGLAAAAPNPAAAGVPAAVTDGLPALTSHRAVYDLTLSRSTGNKAPTAARGRIAFDFTGSACEGYVQNFRQLTELQPAEGPTHVSDMRSATFEDGAGKSFRFRVETTVDKAPGEAVDGEAQRSDDGALSIDLKKPRRAKVDLGEDVVFPTEHLRRILVAARAGEKILEVKVYDGSETGEKIFNTTTIIGRPIETAAAEKAAQLPALEGVKRWPVAISYFEMGKKDEAPAYILSFDLYENGISRALKLDYGDFVLSGEMTELDILPSKTCAK